MRKFRKRPLVIEAEQITEGMFQYNHEDFVGIKGVIYRPKTKTVEVRTLEGVLTAGVGDWIIKGVKGELYPCEGDIFSKTYDEVIE